MRKYIYAIMMATVAMVLCASADKQVVDFTKLPQQAQTFVETNFADKEVATVYYNNDIFYKDYELYFSDSAKIKFEYNGEWKVIEDNKGGVPMSVVPAGVSQYITESHPDMPIVKLERTRYGFRVELSSDIIIKFNKDELFMSYDD